MTYHSPTLEATPTVPPPALSQLRHPFGSYEYRRTSQQAGGLVFHLRPRIETIICPCGSPRLHHCARRVRRLPNTPLGDQPTWLSVEIPRLECPICRQRVEVQPILPG